ncbi:MAG TPA: YicC/YloC family endoribonuclease [Gammaproteobacteria bacterium]|nr:YicC/YloC family endoribonuclease [Gammaproteobacteria bacterium]
MIRSMTAYDRKERLGPWGRLSWELRSVNHRYLDIYPRLPDELRQLEPLVRERVAAAVARGKVECTLRFQPAAGVATELDINWQFAERLLSGVAAIAEKMNSPAPVSPLELLKMPGVIQQAELDLEPIAAAALELLDEALAGFVDSREREGARLGELIRERAERIAVLAEEVRGRRLEVNAKVREKLLGRLREIDSSADPQRLEQELVIIAQRMDVEEELERLSMHVEEVQRVLRRREPVGRRLDFLMQELNREANTLSSKSADGQTTTAAVDMKLLIEQMREQIQNIE